MHMSAMAISSGQVFVMGANILLKSATVCSRDVA